MPPKRKTEEPESTSKRGRVAEAEPKSAAKIPRSKSSAADAPAAGVEAAPKEEAPKIKPLAKAADPADAAKAKVEAAHPKKVAAAAGEAVAVASEAPAPDPDSAADDAAAPRKLTALASSRCGLAGLALAAWAVAATAPWQGLFVDDALYGAVARRNATAVAAALGKYDGNGDGALDESEQSHLQDALNFKRWRWACPAAPLVWTAAAHGDAATAALLLAHGAAVDAPAPPRLPWYHALPLLPRRSTAAPAAPLTTLEPPPAKTLPLDEDEEPDAADAGDDDDDDEPNIDDAPPAEAGVAHTHEESRAPAQARLAPTLLHAERRARGRTPLMAAAAAGDAPLVLLLLRHHARALAADGDGHAALHFAAAAPRGGSNTSSAVQVVQALLSHGAAKAALSYDGLTPLDVAEALNHGDLVPLLR